jgi:hypothetical protein
MRSLISQGAGRSSVMDGFKSGLKPTSARARRQDAEEIRTPPQSWAGACGAPGEQHAPLRFEANMGVSAANPANEQSTRKVAVTL